MTILRYSILNPRARAPSRKHPQDAGIDVYAVDDVDVSPTSCKVVHTGLVFEIPEGFMLQAWPKSRSDFLIGAGIIDSGYSGEILIKVVNASGQPLHIAAGEAVAQLVLVPVRTDELVYAPLENLYPETRSQRGATGGIVGQ